MWQFLKDLKEGREFEHKVLEIIQKTYPSEKWERNTIERWVDIVSSEWKTVEVKFDRKALDTWNLFIEVECNGKPSWINAYDKIDVLAYIVGETIYLFNVEKLKKAIQDTNFRRVKWGDWWRVTWVLIPITIGEQLVSKKIILWQQQ